MQLHSIVLHSSMALPAVANPGLLHTLCHHRVWRDFLYRSMIHPGIFHSQLESSPRPPLDPPSLAPPPPSPIKAHLVLISFFLIPLRSQVPKLLFQHTGQPVLCTQPRKLAAIAIATRVCEEMRVPLGETVGFHVGSHNASSLSKTQLLFASAGVSFNQHTPICEL